jgi:hypothetical protein
MGFGVAIPFVGVDGVVTTGGGVGFGGAGVLIAIVVAEEVVTGNP